MHSSPPSLPGSPSRRARHHTGPLARVASWGTSALLLGSVASCWLEHDGLGPEEGVAGHGATGTGTGGAGGVAGECGAPAECPGEDTECAARTCLDGLCGWQYSPEGAACGAESAGQCDGEGSCLAAQGDPCSAPAECASGHCVDAVCCDAACDGLCEACNQTTLPGYCLPQPAATDPEDECPDAAVCDGARDCALGGASWAIGIGDTQRAEVRGVATVGQGAAVVAGFFAGTVDFGGATVPLASTGSTDGFVAKLDAAGQGLWSVGIGESSGSADQRATAVTLDPFGDLVVVGDFVGQLRIGTSTAPLLAPGQGKDLFVAKLETDGTVRWRKTFGGNRDDFAHDVAVAADGSIVVYGLYRSASIAFDAGHTVTNAADGSLDLYLVRLDLDGNVLWAHGYGDSADQCYDDTSCGGIVLDDDGSTMLVGGVMGTVDFGGGPLTPDGTAFSAYAAKLDPEGQELWSTMWGDGAHQALQDVVLDQQGRLLAVGNFWGATVLGGTCPGLTASDAESDVVLVRLDATTGGCLEAALLPAAGRDWGYRVAEDASGNVLVAGGYQQAPDFGTGPLPSGSGVDSLFVLKRASDGTPLWAEGFAGGSGQWALALALDAQARPWLGGWFETSIDFGAPTSPLSASGTRDGFVVVLEP